MVNGFKLDQMPSIKCSNSLKCITIAKGFTPNWAILARKLLKLKKSLSGVSVKSGQDQFVFRTITAFSRDQCIGDLDKLLS